MRAWKNCWLLKSLHLFVLDPKSIVLDCFTFQHELFFERLFRLYLTGAVCCWIQYMRMTVEHTLASWALPKVNHKHFPIVWRGSWKIHIDICSYWGGYGCVCFCLFCMFFACFCLLGWVEGRLVGWLVKWLIGWYVGWLDVWVVGWMVVWLIGCLNGWLVGWLVG